MPDWSSSMEQTFEYYVVNAGTWKNERLLDTITSCQITRDAGVETLGSATMDVTDMLGECYVRVYLVTIQNGITEKFPLGTFLVQTPSTNFDGKVSKNAMDAYTPLLELKDNKPPIGYYVEKNENVMDVVYRISRERLRAPVVKATCSTKVFQDFVAYNDDTWLSYLRDLASSAEHSFDLDEMGRVLFSPIQDTASLQPVWTFTDDNSSILYPDFDLEHDMYNIPNVLEVIYSSDSVNLYSRLVNDDPNSPISTVNRGREVLYRETNPDIVGDPTQEKVDEYAIKLLKKMSTLEYTVSYKHGYCPVRVGDCVRLDYKRANVVDVKAKVISQTIDCERGCSVTEKAIFTTKLWR